MQTSQYEFDIALSFVAKDEALATQLADQFEGRLKVFLYSRRQEQLAGTDGEKTFNDVFLSQARLVVVMFRDEWGQTPWTRIEETAIRNRAFNEGYDFVIFIPLGDKPSVPKWLPKSQLWVGLNRWGATGAASVIDARFQELGGEPKLETLAHRAARVERAANYQKERAQYLGSDSGVRGANESFEALKIAVLDAIPSLIAAAPSLEIATKHQDRILVIRSTGPALSVNWRLRYSNTLSDSKLEASIWRGHPPYPGVQFYDQPTSFGLIQALPDLDPSGTHAWSTKTSSGIKLLSATELSDYILNWWLEKADSYKHNE